MTSPVLPRRGNFRGSGVLGAVSYFEERYGRAAMHAVAAQISTELRTYLNPQLPLFGLLATTMYPYALIGQVLRGMISAMRPPDEDQFLREIAAAGMDRSLNTVFRAAMRFMVTPESYAPRAQEIWNLYHDSGTVTVLSIKSNEYRVQLSDWPQHDNYVCRICMEARRRALERMGAVDVEARREKCQGWGHDVCTHAFKWTRIKKV